MNIKNEKLREREAKKFQDDFGLSIKHRLKIENKRREVRKDRREDIDLHRQKLETRMQNAKQKVFE